MCIYSIICICVMVNCFKFLGIGTVPIQKIVQAHPKVLKCDLNLQYSSNRTRSLHRGGRHRWALRAVPERTSEHNSPVEEHESARAVGELNLVPERKRQACAAVRPVRGAEPVRVPPVPARERRTAAVARHDLCSHHQFNLVMVL